MTNNEQNFTAEELVSKIFSQNDRYKDAIKSDKELHEAKEIRDEIRKLTAELEKVLTERKNWLGASPELTFSFYSPLPTREYCDL